MKSNINNDKPLIILCIDTNNLSKNIIKYSFNQAKKMNTRASMRAEALDVKAQEELVPEVQLTVVCWS